MLTIPSQRFQNLSIFSQMLRQDFSLNATRPPQQYQEASQAGRHSAQDGRLQQHMLWSLGKSKHQFRNSTFHHVPKESKLSILNFILIRNLPEAFSQCAFGLSYRFLLHRERPWNAMEYNTLAFQSSLGHENLYLQRC